MANYSVSAPPQLDLKTPMTKPPLPLNMPFVDAAQAATAGAAATIDINRTVVTDGTTVAYLSSIIKLVDPDQKKLVLDSAALVSTTDANSKPIARPLDYKYDDDSDRLGVGTAFLQE